ncbi:MAG: hypothetical protein HY998_05260 [candidate division NC10 bacterium]|nr:hypothetical protein [candidate division NC10 bacterium]
MAKENNTTKLASRTKAPTSRSVGNCQCGGELVWSRVYMRRARMMKVCEKCGTMYPKEGY